jgi:hypothetical protein
MRRNWGCENPSIRLTVLGEGGVDMAIEPGTKEFHSIKAKLQYLI